VFFNWFILNSIALISCQRKHFFLWELDIFVKLLFLINYIQNHINLGNIILFDRFQLIFPACYANALDFIFLILFFRIFADDKVISPQLWPPGVCCVDQSLARGEDLHAHWGNAMHMHSQIEPCAVLHTCQFPPSGDHVFCSHFNIEARTDPFDNCLHNIYTL